MIKKISEYKYGRADIDKASAYIEDATAKVRSASDAAALVKIRAELNDYFAGFSTEVALAMIRHSLDVRDGFYAAEQDYYDENLPKLSAKTAEFNRALIESPYASELRNLINPLIMDKTEAGLRVMDERIVDDCVEENKLITEYDKLLAELTYPWRGKNVTLSEMHGFCKDPDRTVRKQAFTVIGETLASVGDKLDDIYDRMVKVRDRMAKKMGFANFVEMGDLRIGHIGYGRTDIEKFRKSVLNDVVPTLVALKSELAERLGLDRVRLYDNDIYCGRKHRSAGQRRRFVCGGAENIRRYGSEARYVF